MTATVDFDITTTAPATAPATAAVSAPARGARHAAPETARAPRYVVARRRLRHVRRFLSGAALALVALTAIAAAAVVIWFRLSFAPVLSPSMEPTFGPGDLLITKALPSSEIRVGDVLILPIPQGGYLGGTSTVAADAKAGDRYVHRVTEVTYRDGKPVVKTKGDNNPSADPWQLQIDSPKVPEVVRAVPNVGRLSLLTQGAAVRIGLILVVAVFSLVGIKRALLDRG